ncbi:lysophospholipid acyltransferase family protein [Aestuariivirga sp.]|uniref:lysophospholipid acyltransferase family protein n=1 Tax=Aestuariivirga sp. TaxID=2650926 RepID=UPI0025C49461|nr:lysophospholipid acyltransferase family protein [Aestuariivirga sp.]MCA3555335.1 lysophospholipid acyltransferase family protein [Aestuariivirga sp.]
MSETFDYLGIGTASNGDGIRFSYSRPEQRWANRGIIRAIEWISGQPHLERLYRAWSANPPEGENIFAAAVRLLAIDVDIDAAAWARLPRQGPVLFVANHPFGVIDGLLMGDLATRVRPDTKIMTHSLLCQIPEARDYLLPVDFGGTPDAVHTSAMTRRRAAEWLRNGHAVAIFPAGSVSTAPSPFRGPAVDAAWHSFAAKLALLPGVTTVPVCFQGENSRLFQIVSHIHYALRVALLFRESRRRQGSRISVALGEPVAAEELAALGPRDAVTRELRRRTLSLRGPEAPSPDLEFRWPRHISFD